MVYKKYIKRGGKIYGPYKYHSRKINGKVITEYLGKDSKKTKKNLLVIFLIIGFILLCSLIFILNHNPNFVKTITSFTIFREKSDDNLAFIRFVIEITKAEHLDSNRQFISDIYNKVRALDDIWSEPISNNEYIRVTFEENLTSKSDITIYPRIIDGTPRIEVYEVGGIEIIAEFTNIISNEYNKIYLTNLSPRDDSGEPQNTFDLRVLDGSLEFDYIYDPLPYSSMEVKR